MQDPTRNGSSLWSVSEPTAGALTSDDFVFHMYRGSELLKEQRVHEAKEEIERALKLQPSDPKGQDLLANVYFRLGLYPRAIAIYEELIAEYPGEPRPRINVSLCYLKTGQPERARPHLEEVVRLNPKHERAWSYLGLALERARDFERARACFERGGQKAMARRMSDMAASRSESGAEADPPDVRAALRTAAAEAFHELDAGELLFSLATPSDSPSAGSWEALSFSGDLCGSGSLAGSVGAPPAGEHPAASPSIPPAQRNEPGAFAPRSVCRLDELSRQASLVGAPAHGRVAFVCGALLVRSEQGFGVRLDLVRAMSGLASSIVSTTLTRKSRGRSLDQPLGSPTRPVCLIRGASQLVLEAPAARTLLSIQLNDEFVYLREDVLAGLDQLLQYDNGSLVVGEGQAIPMVHVRGTGLVLVEAPSRMGSLEVSAGAGVVVRPDVVIGWTGRLVPRPLSVPEEAPMDLRGWVTLSGDGSVWIDTAER